MDFKTKTCSKRIWSKVSLSRSNQIERPDCVIIIGETKQKQRPLYELYSDVNELFVFITTCRILSKVIMSTLLGKYFCFFRWNNLLFQKNTSSCFHLDEAREENMFIFGLIWLTLLKKPDLLGLKPNRCHTICSSYCVVMWKSMSCILFVFTL